MYLIIGLGNPGKQYEQTRHNFGRLVLLSLADDLGEQWDKHEKLAKVIKTELANQEVVLALPETFMNGSGQAVKALAKFYKITTDNIIVIYDDIDLNMGRLKISINSSSGGHQGIQSIIDQLGVANFLRIRLGIGPQKGPSEKYVLAKFNLEQMKQLLEMSDRSKQALTALLTKGLEKTASEFNAT